jgi:hypothetical protein
MEQNRILRDKLPRRISIKAQERRRRVEFGRGLKRPLIKELLTCVTPRTFARRMSDDRKSKSKLLFIHVGSQRPHIAGVTANSDEA